MLGFLDLGLSLLSSHFHKGRERERERWATIEQKKQKIQMAKPKSQ